MKLSIITINYNNAEGLRKTMESVFAQTNKEFEYIVVDGASTDGSVAVIKVYADRLEIGDWRLENFKWVSEKDAGIYNAMNKGVRMAKGEYVLMLNSGDAFVDEKVIDNVVPQLDGADIIQGNIIAERYGQLCRFRGYGRSDIDLFDIMKGHFLHQASFCRRDLFDRYGYFDEHYRMSADTKFFMLCLGKYDTSFKYIDVDIADYDMTGISAEKSGKWAECRINELRRIRGEVFSGRAYYFMFENDKKIRLYNELHAHKWIWNLVMLIQHINHKFYKYHIDDIIEPLDTNKS